MKTHKCQGCDRVEGKPYECPYKHNGTCTCNGNPFSLCDPCLEEYERRLNQESNNGNPRFGVCHFIMEALSADIRDEKVILT